MMIRITQVFALMAGLSVTLLFSDYAEAAPAGLPQHMVPAYMPASPAQGVASFRPHYRTYQPVRHMPIYAQQPRRLIPVQHHPVRRAVAWPLPVSYRPIVQMPPRSPVGYYSAPWARQGYPVAATPFQRYPMRPMPRMAYGYPYPRQAMPRRGGPQGYPGFTGYRPSLPVYNRPPAAWMPPVRSAMRSPAYSYPQPRMMVRPAIPGYQPMPGRLARYQPYYNRALAQQRDYRFRPDLAAVAYQQQLPVYRSHQSRGAYPAQYRFRPDFRYPSAAINPMAYRRGPNQQGNPGVYGVRNNETLAWSGAPYQGRY